VTAPVLTAQSRLSPGLVEGIAAWAEAEGLETPVFGFVPDVLPPGVERLRAELGGRISYSTKANPHPLVLRELVPLVDEFNVTNLVHLDDLLALGVEPGRVMWLHTVVAPKTLEAVLARGVRRFVVDDRRGVDLLAATGADVAVTLRLLPPDTGEAERSVVRFGNTVEALEDVARHAVAAGLRVEGLSFFVGTDGEDMGEAAPYRAGIETLAGLHETLREGGIAVGTIVVGGGFPGSRRRFYVDYPGFLGRVREALEDAFGPGVTILSEPGRYLAEPTLVMLTRVVADRVVAGRRLVYLDASAYGGLFETTFIEPDSGPTIATRAEAGPPAPAEVLGPIMDSFDVLQKGGALPPVAEGELVVLPNVGAYAIGFVNQCEGIRSPEVVPLPEKPAAALAEEWYE